MAWKTLGEVAQYINGRAFKPDEWEDDGLPIVRIQNLTGSTEICNRTTKTYEEKYLVVDGDLLFAWSASLGAHIWHGENAWLNQHIFKIVPHEGTDKQYLYYYLLHVVDKLYAKTHGSGMVHITLKPFKNTEIYIPSLSEQHRIVSHIESLFAKLDEAKEKAQAVVDGFELRKSAILHKAFTGELTERWRSKNDMSLTDWRQVKFGDLGVLERGRSKHRPRNDPKLFGGKYPFIQTGDVARSGMYVVEHSQTLSEIGMEQSRIFPKDTLCITIAANIGDVAILTYDCCFPDSVVGFTPNDLTSSKFIYYMMSTIQHELEATAPATAQKNINLKILNDLMINLPSISEQREILTVLENIFEKQQQAKEAAEAVLSQIDTMKKAILARAFRGELGTNDPAEESAVELIKAVL